MGDFVFLGIFIVGMILFIRYVWRKGERNWEDMMERERKHSEWMVEFGRSMERYDQRRVTDASKCSPN